jgi:hypothetical protein
MKFMVTWRVHDERRQEALEHFSAMTAEDDAADQGDVELIGRWHDLVSFTGVAICEAPDAAAVAKWILNWNAVMDAEVTPVLDDAETRAIGRARS